MTQVDFITSLPTSVSCGILRDWLCLKSVITLDTSYCCKTKRWCWEEVLQSNEYFVREKITLTRGIIGVNGHNSGLWKFGEKIRSIHFKGMLFDSVGVLVADRCRNLTQVYYTGSECEPSLLWHVLQANPGVEYLNMEGCGKGRTISLNEILLPNLKTLVVKGFQSAANCLVDSLTISSNITQLDLYPLTLSERKLLEIQLLGPHLTSLGLAYCIFTRDDVICTLTSFCPNIKHLNIEGVSVNKSSGGITDEGILAIVQNLKELQSLNIKNNDHLTDASLVHIYTHCAKRLHTLHLNCSTEEGLRYVYSSSTVNALLERCTSLTNMYFDYWHVDDHWQELDVGIVFPPITTQNLRKLVLGGNVVSDRNLHAISTYGENLQTLAIFEASS